MNANERASVPHNAAVGRRGEDIAVAWLQSQGMTVVERNWRCADGEIDVVAVDGDTLVVVEVKTRTGPVGGHPLESITRTKRARLRTLAARWRAAHPVHRSQWIRLDAVAVRLSNGRHTVEHVRGIV